MPRCSQCRSRDHRDGPAVGVQWRPADRAGAGGIEDPGEHPDPQPAEPRSEDRAQRHGVGQGDPERAGARQPGGNSGLGDQDLSGARGQPTLDQVDQTR
jgi:hypothetical protein